MRLMICVLGWAAAALLAISRVRGWLARRRLRSELFEFFVETDSGINTHNFRREDTRSFIGSEDPEVYRYFDERLVDELDEAIRMRYKTRRDVARSGLGGLDAAVDYLAAEGVLGELGLSTSEARSRLESALETGSSLESAAAFAQYAPSRGPEGPVRYPAEFEPVGAVLLAWPIYYAGKWGVHARLVEEISKESKAVVVVPDEWWQAVVSLYLGAVSPDVKLPLFMRVRLDDVWMRDFGPTTVLHGADQRPAMIANPYAQDFVSYMKHDAEVAPEVARALGVPVFRLPLVVEGGNLETDGRGTLFMADSVLTNNPDVDDARLRQIAARYFGCERVILLPRQPHDVVGHVDTMVRLTDASTALVPRVHAGHPGHQALERTAQLVSATASATGEPYRVLRLPEPWDGAPAASKDWSYANSLFVNGRVLVPVYGCDQDEEALDVYRSARPDLEIVGIDYTTYPIGGLHCQTKDIPLSGLPPLLR
jgi:agmatine deiminase